MMARINIEDSIYRDGRFGELMIKCGSLDMAIGKLVRAWSLAQKWYLKNDRMIPISEWDKQRMDYLIIEVGLADKIGNFIRMRGADEQFKWLLQRSDAGRRGGQATVSGRQAVVKPPFSFSNSNTKTSTPSCKKPEESNIDSREAKDLINQVMNGKKMK